MLDEYNTILETAEAELIEKKSRFIATVRPVKSEDEARAVIAENTGTRHITYSPIR